MISKISGGFQAEQLFTVLWTMSMPYLRHEANREEDQNDGRIRVTFWLTEDGTGETFEIINLTCAAGQTWGYLCTQLALITGKDASQLGLFETRVPGMPSREEIDLLTKPANGAIATVVSMPPWEIRMREWPNLEWCNKFRELMRDLARRAEHDEAACFASILDVCHAMIMRRTRSIAPEIRRERVAEQLFREISNVLAVPDPTLQNVLDMLR